MVSSPSEHALIVARRVVHGGADREQVGRLYTEYCDYLERGVQGSFTQLLYVRCVIDREAFDRLQLLIPSPALPPLEAPAPAAQTGWGSGVASLPSRTGDSDLARVPADLSMTFAESVEIPPETVNTATLKFQALLPVGDSESTEFQPLGLMEFKPTGAPDCAVSADELSITGSSVEWQTLRLPSRPPAPGDWIGEYELLESVGRGAMGMIFLARKRGTSLTVALKALLPKSGPAGAKARQRFDREVQALERLRHPSLVRVLDSGTSGPIQWYCMDYVQGRSLKDLIEADALDLDCKLRLFLDVCEAITHAHGEGVVHRDLKPANIILEDSGRAVVLDLGLAKITGKEQLALTCTSSPIGTPYYMAPEQLVDPKSVGPCTDVFALGALLYRLTTGRQAFEGESFLEVSQNVLHVDPPPPSGICAELPVEIDLICAKAYQKKQPHRYASVADLSRAVADLLEDDAQPPASAALKDAASLRDSAPAASAGSRLEAPEPAPARKGGGRFLLGFLFGLGLGIGLADFVPLRFQSVLPWWKKKLGIQAPAPLSDPSPGRGR